LTTLENSFEIFYNSTSKVLYNYILKMVRDRDLTQDVLQSAYISVYNKFATLDFPQAYLYKTAYHLAINHSLKSKKDRILKQNFSQKSITIDSDYQKQQKIERALSLLSKKQRFIFMLKTSEGYSYKEISKITSLSEKAVESVLVRARRILRKNLKNMQETKGYFV